jgi:hypothetical protein
MPLVLVLNGQSLTSRCQLLTHCRAVVV